MPDYIEIADASGAKRKVSADELAEAIFAQRFKVMFGANGLATDVSSGSPLPVADAAALEALEAIATALGATVKVGDGLGALTVDGTVTEARSAEILAALEYLGSLLEGSGALAVSGTVGISGTVDPRGNVAHDAADSGNPVKVGGKSRTALVAVSAASDRTDLSMDKLGRVLELAAPLDARVRGLLNRVNNTAADVIAAPGENQALVITNLKVVNGHATQGTKVEILDNETQVDLGYAGPLGGGWVVENKDGLFPPLATNKALRAKCVTTGADVDIFASGYKIPA